MKKVAEKMNIDAAKLGARIGVDESINALKEIILLLLPPIIGNYGIEETKRLISNYNFENKNIGKFLIEGLENAEKKDKVFRFS